MKVCEQWHTEQDICVYPQDVPIYSQVKQVCVHQQQVLVLIHWPQFLKQYTNRMPKQLDDAHICITVTQLRFQNSMPYLALPRNEPPLATLGTYTCGGMHRRASVACIARFIDHHVKPQDTWCQPVKSDVVNRRKAYITEKCRKLYASFWSLSKSFMMSIQYKRSRKRAWQQRLIVMNV